MSGSSLSTKVLEAGGHIESRCLVKNLPNFTEQYVFDKESLERFIEQIVNDDRSKWAAWATSQAL
jgi:hypothetical protein